jgi:hypothetical protein
MNSRHGSFAQHMAAASQRGAAALLMAIAVVGVAGTVGYIASQDSMRWMEVTQATVRKMRLTDISVGFARDLASMIQSGLIQVDPATTRISAPELANTTWRVSNGAVGADICYETGVGPAPGESCGRVITSQATLSKIIDVQRLGANGQTEHVKEAEFDLQTAMDKATFRKSLRVELKQAGAASDGTCPYSDPTFVGDHFFFIEAARVHTKGWAKIGNGIVSNSGPVNIQAAGMRREREGSWANHNYRFPVSTSEKRVANYNMTLNGWGYMAELHIPTADEGTCYWRIFPYRRQGIGSGCFVTGTRLAMADGSTKAIEDVKAGDLVENPLNGQAVPVRYMRAGPEVGKLYVITTESGSVTVTAGHAMVTASGIRRADQLTKGELITTRAGVEPVLSLIMRESHGETVYNLAVGATASDDARAHAVLANGVVTGDLTLQERLENRLAADP